MKDKLLIIGASGHGKVVADTALKMNQWESISFLDDKISKTSPLGLEVIGSTADMDRFIEDYDIFVGIGNNSIRKTITERLEKLGASVPLLVHPSSIIGKEVQIESGTVIMAGTVINVSTVIGKGCIVNTGATIDHDNIIGNFAHISPGAHLSGTVSVGQSSWLGAGSVVSNNIHVTNDCVIGAGGVVVNDIRESGTYVGVPVRRI